MQEYGCGMSQSGNKPPKELQSKGGGGGTWMYVALGNLVRHC